MGVSRGSWRGSPRTASPRNGTPIRRQVLRSAQRQGKNRVGRIRSATGREDAGSGDVEVRHLVGPAKTVDHGVVRAGAHDGAAHQMDCRHRGAQLPSVLGAGRAGNLLIFLEIDVPECCLVP